MMEKLKNLNSTASRAQKTSSAETLISVFEERSDNNFLYLTYEPTKLLMLMTGNYNTIYFELSMNRHI